MPLLVSGSGCMRQPNWLFSREWKVQENLLSGVVISLEGPPLVGEKAELIEGSGLRTGLC